MAWKMGKMKGIVERAMKYGAQNADVVIQCIADGSFARIHATIGLMENGYNDPTQCLNCGRPMPRIPVEKDLTDARESSELWHHRVP